MRRHLLPFVLCVAALPDNAEWRATTPAAEQSVKTPRIAAALEATQRFDQAIRAKDEATFASMSAEEAKFAGKKVRRRTTEIWTDVSGEWQLSLRQATIYSAE